MSDPIGQLELIIKAEILKFAREYRNFEIGKCIDGHGDECDVNKFACSYQVDLRGKDRK